MPNQEQFRVRIAAEVDLGHDQVVGGVEVLVNALNPQLATIVALQQASTPMGEALGLDNKEVMHQLSLIMQEQMGRLGSLLGFEPDKPEEKQETEPPVLPSCKCGHPYHEGFCRSLDCACPKYELP